MQGKHQSSFSVLSAEELSIVREAEEKLSSSCGHPVTLIAYCAK